MLAEYFQSVYDTRSSTMFHGSGEKLVFKTKHGIRMKKGNITDFVFTFSHIATILNEAQS